MRAAYSLAAALAVALAGVQGAAAEVVERSGPADPRGEVEIVNVAGNVSVVGWDKSEVQVSGDLDDHYTKLEFQQDGSHTLIKVALPRGERRPGSADLTVRVPRGSSLAVKTVSADQSIREVRGAQQLQAVSGHIETELWDAEFEAKTVSGNIVVRGHGGKEDVRVTSISGHVQLSDIGPSLELNTVSGDMDVRMDQVDRARIKTTNGNLDMVATLRKDARVEAESVNGDLSFSFRGKIAAEFDIETFNGDIDNCFGPKPRRSREYGPGNELRFTQGSSDARVRIKTLNGGVTLCKR
jgi:DUF4097 and DUF4098 domain-containing protein YvlB